MHGVKGVDAGSNDALCGELRGLVQDRRHIGDTRKPGTTFAGYDGRLI